jgi:hypothetical protein
MSIDYKHRYQEILQKFLTATDTLYRVGFEEGLKEGRNQAMQQQMAMQQQQMAAMQGQMMGGGQPPMEGGGQPMSPEEEQAMMEAQAAQEQGGGMPQDIMADEGMEQGSELDAKVAELEALLQKGEKPSYVALRKVVNEINEIRKSRTKKQERIVTAQRKVVEGLLKKWEVDVKDNTDIEKMIREEGIKLD